jgi:GT2 family glycosyltransferase
MKIKFYVVTYNRKDHLNKTLESLFSTDISSHDVEVYVVNNHTNFSVEEKFSGKIKVLHNVMRPDFSTGHLSRNYNEIFIHGFRDLSNPDCDILMHSHDDNTFHPQLFSKMVELHSKFDLITFSQGCGFMSYNAEAVKKIGMWDEKCNYTRLCTNSRIY